MDEATANPDQRFAVWRNLVSIATGLSFEIIAFPDGYMAAVKPLRDAVAANWKGLGKALPDFGSNIEFLRSFYALSRSQPNKPPACPEFG